MAEFILKDWYGKDQVFDKKTIYVQGTDGELLPFTHGDGNPVIEPLNVTENGTYEVPEGVNGYGPVMVDVPAPETEEQTATLELADGDQVIEPSDGKHLSKVTITKPETLLPENIAEGVDIAGVIGTLVAGEIVKIAGGTITGTGGSYTLTHGLGVVPDVVAVITSIASGTYLRNAVGFSSKILELTGMNFGQVYVDGSTPNSGSNISYIENSYGRINKANEETVNVTSLESGKVYYWLAIGFGEASLSEILTDAEGVEF